jgi:hypothetical protein
MKIFQTNLQDDACDSFPFLKTKVIEITSDGTTLTGIEDGDFSG